MIILNTDKGIVRIDSWQEILDRPGYRKKLDPKQVKLKGFLGLYQFKDEVHCGLTSCNQPHGKGYLVETDTGLETNIGKDCGKVHLGAEFEAMRRNFDRDIARKVSIETIQAFQARLPARRAELKELKDGARGAGWAHKQSQFLREQIKGLGGVVRAVDDMLRLGSGNVVADRPATDAEQDAAEGRAGRKLPRQRVQETVATVVGLGFFSPDLDLRKLITEDIDKTLEVVEQLDVQQADPKALRVYAKWAGEYDGKIATIRRALDLAAVLLTQENLAPLARYAGGPDAQAKVRAYLRGLPKAGT